MTSTTVHASAYEKYPVSPLAWEVNVERVGDVLLRYVNFLSESEYPCLRLETFEPINLRPIDRKDICKIKIDQRMIDVRKGIASVEFRSFAFKKGEFLFNTNILVAAPGELFHYLNCKVTISDKGKLSEPACAEGVRPPKQDNK